MPKTPTLALTFTTALLLCASIAQAQPKLSHDQAVATARGLAMQHTWAQNCPYSKENQEVVDFFGLLTGPSLELKPEELKRVGTAAEASALKVISTTSTKTDVCETLEKEFERMSGAVEDLMRKK